MTKRITYDDIVNLTCEYFKELQMQQMDEITGATIIRHGNLEVVPGYVEAWRWFEAAISRNNDGSVASIHPISTGDGDHVYEWDGENVAYCPPTLSNNRGFYAYKQPYILDHQAALFGRVALYGDIVECEYGYRAEKCRILDVWVRYCDLRVNIPDVYQYLMDIPQVKGAFDAFDPSLIDWNGNKGDYQCLTLESRKELSGTSLSGGQTTMTPDGISRNMILIDMPRENQNQKKFQSDPMNWMPFQYGYSPSSDVTIVYEPKQWVLKPEGRQCSICEHMIMDGDMVAVSYESPENFQADILANRFEWRKKWYHLECMTPKGWMFTIGSDPQPIYWANNSDPAAWPVMVDDVFQKTAPVTFSLDGLTI